MSEPHRFFIAADVIADDRATIRGAQARQIAGVLRLGPGDEVVLVRDGDEARVRLESVARGRVEGVVVARAPAANEPRLRLTLALPLLRGERSEEVVEAVTQLGVARIVPFTSERSVVRELSEGKRERWERIARESAETARRGRVPGIGRVTRWPQLFDQLEPPVLVAWEQENETTLRNAIPHRPEVLSVVIGPEGGLSEAEIALAHAEGATTITLGPLNLRSETAAIAAVSQIFAFAEQ